MAFNELNSVEHYIVHQLSGVNLNASGTQDRGASYVAEWQYEAPNEIATRWLIEVWFSRN